MTVDQQIVDAIGARLATITVANGYATDAGLNVVAGDRDADESDSFPLLTYADAEEEVAEYLFETDSPMPDRLSTKLTVTVTGHAAYGSASPGTVARELIGDIKKAVIDATDKRLGGLLKDPLRYEGRTIELPDPGQKIVSVEVRFAAHYLEQAGDPAAILTN